MSHQNKAILQKANAAISQGDYEGFLSHCTEDTEWEFVGEQTLRGKNAVRQYMAETYKEPPKFAVANLIGDGELVAALGTITLKNNEGQETDYQYCDVWTFRNGQMASLKAFVLKG